MRTLEDLDVAGRRVLIRADFNVPLEKDGSGPARITDDSRIRAALPTLERLYELKAAKYVLLAHLGRPKGRDPEFSLAPVATRLSELLKTEVALVDDPESVGDAEITLVENVRFFEGETDDSAGLAKRYAATADVYINDAFGAAHRAHASTHAVARELPSAAGLLLTKEVTTLTGLLQDPERPVVAIVGGSKVSDKIGVLERFLEIADTVVIGGAMCFPFFKAQGYDIGDSLCEADGVPLAEALLKSQNGGKLRLPTDLVAGRAFSADTETKAIAGVDVPSGWMGLDIGLQTAAAYAEIIRAAKTAFWNGPMGAFELEPFAAGTRAVADALTDVPASIVGGGDSVAAVMEFGMQDRYAHVSTGGGASLELIEGKTLPGVEVLSQ
ncbi:MAG TPA: phosphoglycerate kinase [Baekduia sp.]|nr:phosphoglycerate kinase [Baekduia sp.]